MQEQIRAAITEALAVLDIEQVAFSVEHPAELTNGDYATNVALVAAKVQGGTPREFAERIRVELEKNKPQGVEKIEIAGLGFINFHLSRQFFAERVQEVLEKKDDWGKNNCYAGKRVMVEYTDPNPFKELHIGHLVPNALGESIVRLLLYAGAEVKRVTFQGDVGMHVAKAIYGMQKRDKNTEHLSATDLGKAYAVGATDFDESLEAKTEITKLNKAIYERTDERVNALYDTGKAVSLASFVEGYQILGSAFDHNFFESETGPVGVTLVRAHPEIFESSDGAIIFRGEKYGLHTRVFVNTEGLPTYEAKDIGLIEQKHAWWPFDLSITVTGSEQQQYFAVMTKAATLVNPVLAGKIELVCNGMLNLPSGKMSSRTGTIVPALSLISEVQQKILARMAESKIEDKETVARQVAVGAIKYAILRSVAGKDIMFDIAQSISLEGASGPYLQYTHARCCSSFAKAKEVGVSVSFEVAPKEAYDIERILYQFPEVTERAVLEREPHYMTTYLTELAGMFNTWYAKEKIVDANDHYSPYKVAVARAVAQTLKSGLWCLGIKAPERM